MVNIAEEALNAKTGLNWYWSITSYKCYIVSVSNPSYDSRDSGHRSYRPSICSMFNEIYSAKYQHGRKMQLISRPKVGYLRKKVLLLKWNVNTIQDLMFFNLCWLFDHSNIALTEYYILNIQHRSTELLSGPTSQTERTIQIHTTYIVYVSKWSRPVHKPPEAHQRTSHICEKKKKECKQRKLSFM